MLFRQLLDRESGTFSYLLAQNYQSDALIIDPVLEQMPLYQRLINEYGLRLRYAIDTHFHADHVTATGKLREQFDCQIVMGEATSIHGIDVLLNDGDSIGVDNIRLKAIHTPGHTADSYCFYGHGMIFTGDTLFIRGTGRTDLPTGSVEDAYNSLFKKILTLPNETIVYPGHDYKIMMMSTIGEERRFNPRLKVDSLEAYREIMEKLNLSKPDQFERAIKLNPSCGLEKD